jgi:hypothetical protein
MWYARFRINRTVTPPLLCSSERQELLAGAPPADIAGKTPLARHRMINLHVLLPLPTAPLGRPPRRRLSLTRS